MLKVLLLRLNVIYILPLIIVGSSFSSLNDQYNLDSTVDGFTRMERYDKRDILSLLKFLLNPAANNSQSQVEWRTDKIIENYDYSCEIHAVETSDGYILEMQRIIARNASITKRRPVLMQHGLLVYGAFFTETAPNITLAYLLSDAGYDVWIGNARGTPHGRKHKTLKADSHEFWNFGLEEQALNDIPAMIDYIIFVTNKPQLYYIGHSMGTTLAFIMLSMKPEYNNKLELLIALAPVAYLHHTNGNLLQLLMKLVTTISGVLRLMGIHQFPPLSMEMKVLSLCENIWSTCILMLKDMNGAKDREFNHEMLKKTFTHYGVPTSLNVYQHFSQIALSKKFQRYDKGFIGNIASYGQKSPPEYPVKSITTPTIFYCGQDDHLSSIEDADLLAQRLPKHLETYVINDKTWSHMDFVFAPDVLVKLNINILRIIQFLERIAS